MEMKKELEIKGSKYIASTLMDIWRRLTTSSELEWKTTENRLVHRTFFVRIVLSDLT